MIHSFHVAAFWAGARRHLRQFRRHTWGARSTGLLREWRSWKRITLSSATGRCARIVSSRSVKTMPAKGQTATCGTRNASMAGEKNDRPRQARSEGCGRASRARMSKSVLPRVYLKRKREMLKKLPDNWSLTSTLTGKELPPCHDPEHEPPKMQMIPEGSWEHVCPSCGNVQVIVIPRRPR